MASKKITAISPEVDAIGRTRSPNQDLGRGGKPQAGDGALKLRCPSYLDARGKAAWREAATALRRKGILDTADGRLLELYASSYSIFRRAEALIKKNGILIEQTAPGGRKVKVANPAIPVRAKSWKEVTELFASLGVGPIARRKLLLTDSDDENEADPFMVLMAMKKARIAKRLSDNDNAKTS